MEVPVSIVRHFGRVPQSRLLRVTQHPHRNVLRDAALRGAPGPGRARADDEELARCGLGVLHEAQLVGEVPQRRGALGGPAGGRLREARLAAHRGPSPRC